MFFYNIQLNPVIFVIMLLEVIIFSHQLLSWLARPQEKDRLWHIIVVALLILYNLAENLIVMPDPHIPLPTTLQVIINQGFGYVVTAYMPLYCYHTMNFDRLGFHRKYGFLFIIIPAVVGFGIYYPLSLDLQGTLDYVYMTTGAYAIVALTATARAIYLQYREDRNRAAFVERWWIFAALVFWCTSPVIGLVLGQPNWVVGVFNNVVFLLLNFLLMRQTVRKSRQEYRQLQESNISLAQRVKERTIQLEKSNEQRTNAFVNLVHETKTPITLMNNYLEEYIQKYGANEDLIVVKRNLDKLNNDISNLFDLERYNKGLGIYNYVQVINFSQILEDNLVLYRSYCQKKNLALTEYIAKNVYIKADPEAISRVINNLVENAIKYTDRGGKINVVLEESEDGRIRFSVDDTGIGIQPDQHGKVFEPYYQINTQKRSMQGMGLGLPIVKKIVDGLQGDVVIDSNPQRRQGTCIAVLLERYVLSEDEMVTSNYNARKYSGLEMEGFDLPDTDYDERKQTILLVEDNNAMLRYLFKKLSERYNVCVALNGNEAMKKFRTYPVPPDLIISDVMMDKVDGFKFARIISENPDYNHIPFIFLSAKFSNKDRSQGLKLGALDYIQKPFRTEELIQKINSVLENAARQKRSLLNNTIRALKIMNNQQGGFREKEEEPTNGFEQNCSSYNLTAREIDIARLICEGHSYKVLGDTLFISERTVKKHVQNIFEKVGVSNKVQLINKLQA
jgi:signal transduction histidine kinase/DNA-binding NarL/FixJ family response regulator